MMVVFASFWRNITAVLLFALLAATGALAQDASIDRLLNKLPPPEKLVKPPVQRAVEQPDPAFQDPIGKQTLQAIMTDNIPQALYLNRKLTERYPRSLGAQYLRGVVAWTVHQYGEAFSAFRAATKIQPRYAPAHFGLAAVEGAQGHFAEAIPHLQRVIELEPKSYLPYFALSDCAWQLGRKEQSVQYAKKATVLAPSVMDTWIELARS
jgi:tetratricopeptide (TPR) repeat protein